MSQGKDPLHSHFRLPGVQPAWSLGDLGALEVAPIIQHLALGGLALGLLLRGDSCLRPGGGRVFLGLKEAAPGR